MNILVVGNGFDLSHFLPTKYDHFMFAMKSIQNFNNNFVDMNYKDIFGELLNTEYYFFDKTRQYYDINQVTIDQEKIKYFKLKLNNNIWYKYFLDHFNQIKTWIDFEQKIEEALILSAKAINLINDKYKDLGSFYYPIYTLPSRSEYEFYLTDREFDLLNYLGLIQTDSTQTSDDFKSGQFTKEFFIKEDYDTYGFDSKKYLYFLQKNLDEFIHIFNLYLCLIIDKMTPYKEFKIKDFVTIDQIYSFNYTSTFEKFYDKNAKIHYLHGKAGDNHNLVLGISEIKHDILKDLRAYSFTKYHQKIFKDTHYNFLSEEITKIKYYTKKIEEITLDYRSGIRPVTNVNSYTSEIQTYKNIINRADLNIFIWGHSLDISDDVYINEIFSFNEPSDNNVRVTIFHFNKSAKFDLLTNLFHILGKEKVEKWMKKGWLTFKENPEITQID
ncbi:AbiH family protein [Acinetobacter baumannii]|uniref:AbiH family protein n=1 Tax=Acinetobacter baumannii TaxID=470 RepID=UPI002934FE01|nr:AbiH family protein [Acinetobacter baumannii]WOE34159.1 AbiH family protein [Acinetobacter baumannii]